MSSLTVRRIIVWVVSMVLGFGIAAFIVTVILPTIGPSSGAISIEKYGRIYFLTTAVPLGLIFVVWLDYFLDTKILPD